MSSETIFRPGDRPLLNLALLIATVATTFVTFFMLFTGDFTPLPGRIESALTFALAIVFILGAHEMGHYVFARRHGVDTSLPYFIPVPFLGAGTLGAVIRIRGRIPHLNALVDIGASGPIAGLLVAIPLMALGFSYSTVAEAPAMTVDFPRDQSLITLLHSLSDYVQARWAGLPPEPETMTFSTYVFGDSLLMRGIQYAVLGPLPQGHDVFVHPLVIASWFGIIVTMLNLWPIGQLDGGHVAYALFGKWAELVGKLAAVGLLFMTLFMSAGWLLWMIIAAKLVGFRHPPVEEPFVPLTRGRKVISVLCLVAFIACLTPVPITMVPLQ